MPARLAQSRWVKEIVGKRSYKVDRREPFLSWLGHLKELSSL